MNAGRCVWAKRMKLSISEVATSLFFHLCKSSKINKTKKKDYYLLSVLFQLQSVQFLLFLLVPALQLSQSHPHFKFDSVHTFKTCFQKGFKICFLQLRCLYRNEGVLTHSEQHLQPHYHIHHLPPLPCRKKW